MTIQSCLNQLLEVITHGDRVGPLVVVGLVNDSSVSANWEAPPAINYQVFFFFQKFVFFQWLDIYWELQFQKHGSNIGEAFF